MDKIARDVVIKKYMEFWPMIMTPPLWDDKYFSISPLNYAEKILSKCKLRHGIKFVEERADCDFFALITMADFHMQWNKDDKYPYQSPFGRASGLKFDGEVGNHTVNVLMVDEGIYLFDPQISKLWSADKKKDVVYLIKF